MRGWRAPASREPSAGWPKHWPRSLTAVVPVSYMAAAIAIAELHEEAGDKVAAYGALASGYATLGDLLGSGAASESFGTKLAECRDRWGPETFRQVKEAYELKRKGGTSA